jgi:8-amino-7-oxononanoate synthase
MAAPSQSFPLTHFPMPSALEERLQAALASRDARGIRRRLAGPSTVPAKVGGTLADFTSNDYLSLASSPTLRDAFLRKLSGAPPGAVLGARGSRLLIAGGPHAALEARALTLLRAGAGGAALLFNSGFDANVALFGAVPQPGDVLLADELVHASVHDGARAGRAHWAPATHTFAHNDVAALAALCDRVKTRFAGLRAGTASAFVAVESVYSMDGTLAPLPEIVATLEDAFPAGNAHLIVDEAHATGVFGPGGAGLVAHYGLEDRVFARLHTFGKALAGTGGASF